MGPVGRAGPVPCGRAAVWRVESVAVNAEHRERSGAGMWRQESRARHFRERAIKVVLMACAYLSILTTFGIVLVLIFETISFFREVSIFEFLTTTEWSPTQG